MKASDHDRSARLASDEGGAIMVIAVFMAVFSVGILYYAVGIGHTILLREHLQDAADASALSGAIMHARGMNFLVLLNIVMAALLAILVAMKALEGLAILGMIIALAMAWFTGGSSLGLIPPLQSLQQTMSNAYESVKPPVFQALELLHTTADQVKEIVPEVTKNMALAEAGAHAVPSAQGIFWQPRSDLPVQDDGFDSLCGKAGEYAGEAVTAPLGKIGVGSLGLGDVVSSFTKSLSSWFCGDSGDPPPKAKRSNVETHFPQSQLAQQCASGTDPVKHSPSGDRRDVATTESCDQSLAEAEAGAPDDETGACKSGGDCGPNGAYERLAATALGQCDPSGSPRPTKYVYQVRRATVPYQWTHLGWKRLDPVYEAPQRQSSDRPPCGRTQDHPTIAVGYNAQIHPRGDLSEIVPVCSKEGTPVSQSATPMLGEIERVQRVEVVHILRCVKYLDKSAAVKGIATAKSDGGGSKSPKMIQSDATLGDQNFQIRTFVTAEPPPDKAEDVIRVSLFGAPEPLAKLGAAQALGNLAMAQSEYFYDASGARGDWMWNMNWRARLTRFRLPSGEGTMDHCKGPCADLADQLRQFDGLFVH